MSTVGSMPIHYTNDSEHVVLITIDRPHARNAADLEHFKLLREAWDRFRDDPQAWVAIITGVDQSFFSGADLKTYIPEITKLSQQIAEGGATEFDGYRLDDGTKAVLRNYELNKPVIAAVNGFCTAGGMELLGGTDIRIDESLHKQPAVAATREILMQVLITLIDQLTSAGESSPEHLRISATCERMAGRAMVSLRFDDERPLAHAREQVALFDHPPATQGDGTSLAWAENAVSAMGGQLFAETSDGYGGLTVRLHLPQAN